MQKLLIKKFPAKSTLAWCFLGFFILIYDVIALALNDSSKDKEDFYETLSDGCWRGVEHPVVRWPIWLFILAIAKHLAAPDFFRKYDPIKIVGVFVRYLKKSVNNG